MRSQKVASENVDQKLFDTFSTLGYDGTSMEILAKATGLKKASLYHRFPNGKREMAQHVLNNTQEWLRENIVKTAIDKTMKPERRLKKVIHMIDLMYNGGVNNCLLRTLSVGTDAEIFKAPVNQCFDLLSEGFTAIGIDFGLDAKAAGYRAKEVNVMIQGSLILAGASGDTSYFKNTIAKIPNFLKP